MDLDGSFLRMAEGLGMTKREWEELRSQVDDSFWVMRVIGECFFGCTLSVFPTRDLIGYPPLPNDHDGFSCGAHKWALYT